MHQKRLFPRTEPSRGTWGSCPGPPSRGSPSGPRCPQGRLPSLRPESSRAPRRASRWRRGRPSPGGRRRHSPRHGDERAVIVRGGSDSPAQELRPYRAAWRRPASRISAAGIPLGSPGSCGWSGPTASARRGRRSPGRCVFMRARQTAAESRPAHRRRRRQSTRRTGSEASAGAAGWLDVLRAPNGPDPLMRACSHFGRSRGRGNPRLRASVQTPALHRRYGPLHVPPIAYPAPDG